MPYYVIYIYITNFIDYIIIHIIYRLHVLYLYRLCIFLFSYLYNYICIVIYVFINDDFC